MNTEGGRKENLGLWSYRQIDDFRVWSENLVVFNGLQILAASTLPVGARTPEDYAVGGVVGTGLALALAQRQPFAIGHEACAWIGVIGGALAALAGVPVLKWQRRRNEALARWCEAEVRSGHTGALTSAQWAAVLLAFGAGVGLTALATGLGLRGLHGTVTHASIKLARGWELAQPLWLGLGLAHLLHAFLQRRLTRAALFAASLLAAWVLRMSRLG